MQKKVKYCVGLNGRPGNLETLAEKYGNRIYEVYAAAPPNVCATGRRGHRVMSLQEIEQQIALAHKAGIRYNVVMNGSCMSGMDFSPSFEKTIEDFVQFLDSAGADSTTIASPFLIDLVRRYSKRIEIIVGSFSEIVEPYKIKRFKKRGANRIVLHQNVYRNFEMMQNIMERSELPLEIIPNQGCVFQCECFISHVNIVAHTSTAKEEDIAAYGNYDIPIKQCRATRQTDPIEFLMSNIIRPEDLGIYEKMGYEFIKLAGRRSSTEWMCTVLDAYMARSYEGNIFDLSSHVGENPKLCVLPNKKLEGWYESVGSNADCVQFESRARAFCLKHGIDNYFQKKC